MEQNIDQSPNTTSDVPMEKKAFWAGVGVALITMLLRWQDESGALYITFVSVASTTAWIAILILIFKFKRTLAYRPIAKKYILGMLAPLVIVAIIAVIAAIVASASN